MTKAASHIAAAAAASFRSSETTTNIMRADATTTTTTTSMQSIAMGVSSERRQTALLGQLDHHRRRRLEFVEERGRNLKEGTDASSAKHHPSSWRNKANQGSHRSLLTGDSRQTQATQDSDGIITSLELSNCHLVLYSGEIALGSNKQRFRVDFDTASSDLWVPGVDCTDCLSKHPSWRLFNATASDSFQKATENPEHEAFHVEYEDGEVVHGDHGIDTLWLGDDTLMIKDVVFAAVTGVDNFATCQEEEGILGLANSLTTSHHFPSLLSKLLLHSPSNNALQNNMFGMYLHAADDYDDTESGRKLAGNNQPKPSASSQLTLGGVDQQHYLGCLQWHDIQSVVDPVEEVIEDNDSNSAAFAARVESNYWSLPLDHVKVGGQVMNFQQNDMLAILDSGSSYIVGPQDEVAQLVKLNSAKCFTLEEFNGASPQEVDCLAEEGFDGAILQNCNDPFFNLEFVLNGIPYVLEKEDLMVQVDTLFGEACILRIVGAIGMEGWVLGDAFLNKYYAAFDFENQKIGLALAAENALDVCDNDMALDINHFWDMRDDIDSGNAQGLDEEEILEEVEEEPFEGDADDQEDITTTTDDTVEVFDYEDAQDAASGQAEEDFDFSQVTDAPGDANDSDANPTPPPAHVELPERQPVPHLTPSPSPTSVSGSSFTAGLPQSQQDAAAASADSNIAIYVVIAAVVAFVAAFIVRKTSQRRQQAMFANTWREAEREIVSTHRNLNYRDHSSSASARNNVGPYRDGGFTDEEQPGDGETAQENFVLDRDMLNKMN